MRETSKGVADDSPAPAPDQGGIEELARAADQLFYAMRRSRAATVGRSATGLSMAQLALLDPLTEDSRGVGLPVSRLAANADISVPTATRMLKQLEAHGVITRRRSDQDERQVLIRLTDDGTRRLTAMRTELRTRQAQALSRFTPQERHALTAQLHQLAGLITDTMTGTDH
ncbi:MarR family transcriptional regulator [Streptomyces sp. 769]|uniref:MarR family winged helix-turn-helix transcriptional regulator n=1 Tax=Streptomyces sp. 769 TaxID=1262452 RepID=UPI00057F6D8D|nr:MarR family transcriptional regulator [Streptomyces sp. 769]AJC61360.1 transcriptional regulator C MarR family [Streptomyces sp. 769]